MRRCRTSCHGKANAAPDRVHGLFCYPFLALRPVNRAQRDCVDVRIGLRVRAIRLVPRNGETGLEMSDILITSGQALFALYGASVLIRALFSRELKTKTPNVQRQAIFE